MEYNLSKGIALKEASPYDDAFPIVLLSNAFELQIKKADELLEDVYESVKQSSLDLSWADNIQDEEKMRLIVDTSDEVLKSIQDGNLKLVEENGSLFAQFRDNGRYGKKLPIKKEYYKNSITVEQISISLQLKTIQDSLHVISNQIKTIDRSVREIIKGQQNDRIGIYYSGVALYIESLNVEDKELKNNLISQSMRSLTEATFQLILMMQSDIQYLKNKEYESQKRTRVRLITEKINNINQCFSIIHQAYIMKAGIYCQQNEIAASCAVLEEYSRFINGTITPNAPMLAQCDVYDNGTEQGVWKKRAKLELDVSNVTKQLQSKNITMIEGEKEYES